MRKVYVAGPMRGYPEFNFPAFNYATKRLREKGYEVFNPAEADGDAWGHGFEKGNKKGCEQQLAQELKLHDAMQVARECFLRDTTWICTHADAIAVLPGWTDSKGARAEVALGEAIGLEIMEAPHVDRVPKRRV